MKGKNVGVLAPIHWEQKGGAIWNVASSKAHAGKGLTGRKKGGKFPAITIRKSK